jgi:hypothetical protein
MLSYRRKRYCTLTLPHGPSRMSIRGRNTITRRWRNKRNDINATGERCHVVVDQSHVIPRGLGYCLAFCFYFFLSFFRRAPTRNSLHPPLPPSGRDHDDDVISPDFFFFASARSPTHSLLPTNRQHTLLYLRTDITYYNVLNNNTAFRNTSVGNVMYPYLDMFSYASLRVAVQNFILRQLKEEYLLWKPSNYLNTATCIVCSHWKTYWFEPIIRWW